MKIEFDGVISLETPTADELARIYDTVRAKMQKDETFKLMGNIKKNADRMANAEGLPETFDGWNLVDKITWFASEAYCYGYVNGIEAAYAAFAELLKEDKKNA